MKKGRKTNVYRRIKKMIESPFEEEKSLARELLLVEDRLSGEDWGTLNELYHYNSDGFRISVVEIKQYLYDKRQEEIRANKGRNTEESKSL